jgi:hypothetical protein
MAVNDPSDVAGLVLAEQVRLVPRWLAREQCLNRLHGAEELPLLRDTELAEHLAHFGVGPRVARAELLAPSAVRSRWATRRSVVEAARAMRPRSSSRRSKRLRYPASIPSASRSALADRCGRSAGVMPARGRRSLA